MRLRTTQTALGIIWLVGVLFLVVIVAIQTTVVYTDLGAAVWQWFLPHVAPTTCIVVASLFYDKIRKTKKIDSRKFWIALLICVVHIIAVGAFLLVQVQVEPSEEGHALTELAVLDNANFVLPFWQGLLDIAFMVFFFTRSTTAK
jgi:hypothetical protein